MVAGRRPALEAAYSCSSNEPLRRQLIEQSLSLFQIKRVEALGKPAVHRSEKFAGFIPLALTAPEPRHAHRRAQFPGLCLQRLRNRDRTLEARLSAAAMRRALSRVSRLAADPQASSPQSENLG
jgi:hypothetical protein